MEDKEQSSDMDVLKEEAPSVETVESSSALRLGTVPEAVTDRTESMDDEEDEIDDDTSELGDLPPNDEASHETTANQLSAGHRPFTGGHSAVYPYYGYPYGPNYPTYGAVYPYHVAPPTYPPPLSSKEKENSSGKTSYVDNAHLADPAPNLRRNRGGVTKPFPEVLYHMLMTLEQEGIADVASFFSHGRAFAIHKPRLFISTVMPRFFKQTKITSFQRQLNLYSFRRIAGGGADNGGYWHPLFLKGRAGLCGSIKRVKMKGGNKSEAPEVEEPNFYLYPPIQYDATSASSYPHPPSLPGYPPATAHYGYPTAYAPWPPYGYTGGTVSTSQRAGYNPYPVYDPSFAYALNQGKAKMPQPSPVQPVERADEGLASPVKSKSPSSVSDTPIRLLPAIECDVATSPTCSNLSGDVLSIDEVKIEHSSLLG